VEEDAPPFDPSRFACVAAAWQAHHAELLGYLRHRLSDTDAAADLLHDVFLKAMRQGRNFCALANPRAWLFQVARNALVDRARSTRPVEPLPDDADLLIAAEPDDIAPVDALTGCLDRCLGELRLEDARVLRACDLEGQTVRAFAEANELTLAAAKARLLRARQRLRARMTSACQVQFGPDGTVAAHVPRPKPD
jgi:RNA polymerase sigma-70 factor (ECF subfamily)